MISNNKAILIASILAVFIGFVGCALPTKVLAPDERTYLNRAMAHPTDFTLSKQDATDAWGRANLFIARYSSMKIQMASDMMLSTYNPTGGTAGSPAFGYTITRTPIKDSIMFTVSCTSNFDFMGKEMRFPKAENRNAHIMALYMATGDIAPSVVNVPRIDEYDKEQ